MTSVLDARGKAIQIIVELADHNVKQEVVKVNLNDLVRIIREEPRATSKTIKIEEKTRLLFEEVERIYSENGNIFETKFMKKLVKHAETSELTLSHIERVAEPLLLAWKGDALLKIEGGKEWFSHFLAATNEPANLDYHKVILSSMPEELNKNLFAKRAVIGRELMEANANSWVDSAKVNEIIAALKADSIEETDCLFEKESIVPYFISCYKKLIDESEDWKEEMKLSICYGLEQFIKLTKPKEG